MPIRHHEVPTHLDVEDKVLFGLTVRQFLYMLVGTSASYALWEQLVSAGDGVRIGATVVCVLITASFALLRPAGRALEDWLFAALFYLATPRSSTWRTAEPDAHDWRPASAAWQELVPSPTWMNGDET